MEGLGLSLDGAGKPAPFSSVLHVGCGGDPLPDWLEGSVETRLDINPIHKPHIVASMTDMGDVGIYDIVVCQHALEHLTPMEVDKALSEFKRVLRPLGLAYIVVPDLEDVKPTDEVLFVSPSGPITGLDMIYGYQKVVDSMPYMQHKTGFTSETLRKALLKHFKAASTKRSNHYNLIGIGVA